MPYATKISVCIITVSKSQECYRKFVAFYIIFHYDITVFMSMSYNFLDNVRH